MESMKDISVRLKYFRSLRNLSQAQLAERAGISRKLVSDYEVGKSSNFRKSTFKKILDALDVTEEEFVNSDCLFESNGQGKQLVAATAIATILASSSRGQLLSISGMELSSPYRNKIDINIYSGTITRTKQHDDEYVNVYYLTGEKEECIFVHKDLFKPILESMK